MSALVIDTSAWVSYFAGQGDPLLIENALDEGRVYLPPVVAAKLASGKMNRRQRAQLEGILSDLPLVECNLHHWLRAGELRSSLRSKGLVISTPDAHVAQCTLDLGGELLTEDTIFGKIAPRAGLALARSGEKSSS